MHLRNMHTIFFRHLVKKEKAHTAFENITYMSQPELPLEDLGILIGSYIPFAHLISYVLALYPCNSQRQLDFMASILAMRFPEHASTFRKYVASRFTYYETIAYPDLFREYINEIFTDTPAMTMSLLQKLAAHDIYPYSTCPEGYIALCGCDPIISQAKFHYNMRNGQYADVSSGSPLFTMLSYYTQKYRLSGTIYYDALRKCVFQVAYPNSVYNMASFYMACVFAPICILETIQSHISEIVLRETFV